MQKPLHFIILFYLLTFLTGFSFAQETLYNTPKHKWDIGAEISSPEEFSSPREAGFLAIDNGLIYNKKDNYAFSVGVFGSYYLKNDIFIRLRASVCNRKIIVHSDNIGDPTNVMFSRDETHRQNSETIILGMGKNIVEQKFIRASIGFELSTTFFGKFTDDYSSNELEGFGGDPWQYHDTYIASGGYAIRMGSFIGGQFVFRKNFSIGPEISFAFQYYNTGGNASQHLVGIDINNSARNYDYYSPNQSTTAEGTGFSKIKAILRITYLF